MHDGTERSARAITVAILAEFLAATTQALPSPYDVWYSTAEGSSPVEITATIITSVLGEPRPLCDDGCSPTGFHQGTDIGNCHENYVVGSIEDGVVQRSP